MMRLKVIQNNIRSIWPKKDILEHYLESNDVDVALLCETWLKDNNIRFKNYNLICSNRDDGYGGVGILIKKSIAYDNLSQIDYNPLESVQITINWQNIKIKIVSLYANPNLKLKEFKEIFAQIFKDNKFEKYVIIGGDVNCHNELWEFDSVNDRKGNSLAELITNSDNLCTLNDGTHTYNQLSRCYSSAIDLTIASRELSKLANWRVDENLTFDHLAIVTEIKHPLNIETTIQTRKIHNQKATIKDLEEIEIDEIANYNELESKVMEIIKKNTRMVNISSKFKPKPWWNLEIKRLWDIKNYKQTLFNQFKSPYTAIELRKINNKLKNIIRKYKRISWEKYLQYINHNTTSKNIWERINKLRQPKSEKSDFFDKNPQEITNFLNFNFPNRDCKTIKIPNTRDRPENIFNDEKLTEIIGKKTSKCPGTDGISYDLLKKLPNRYIEIMAQTFNDIWKTQSFPPKWKEIRVIPIPKPNKNKFSVEGFRPISLLPVPLKCFNMVIKDRLENYFEANNLLPPTSFGFRKEKGTNDIIFNLNSQVMKNKQNKLKQVLISIDFSKAFDNVNLDKLIKILIKFKTEKRTINWLKQFLYNRKIIFEGSNNQQEITTSAGLPQGSCLSPILFNIYTTEFHKIAKENVKIYQFADDFNLLISGKNIRSIKKEIKKAIITFTKIAKKLSLPINCEKSGFMELFRKTKKINIITHNNHTIERSSFIKTLGITYDDKFNFKKHHNILKENMNRDLNSLKIISAINHGIHPFTALNIFKAIIKSRLDYSSLVTSISSKSNLDITQRIQNTALRFTLGLIKSTPIDSINSLSGMPPRKFQNELNIIKLIIKKKYQGNEFNLTDTKYQSLLNDYPLIEESAILEDRQNIKIQMENLILDMSSKSKHLQITVDNAKALIKDKYKNFTQFYTDGSIINQISDRGIGIFNKNTGEGKSYNIKSPVSIKATEIVAIWMAIKEGLHMQCNNIAIFSDSLSSILAINSCKLLKNKKYYEKLILNLVKENPSVNIAIIWIPSHVGLQGNEEADKLAKIGTEGNDYSYTIEIKLDPAECINIIDNQIFNKWTEEYENCVDKGKHLKAILGKPFRIPWFKNSNLSHKNIKLINRLLSGHTYNRKTLYKWKLSDTPYCLSCNDSMIESNNHILFNCTSYEDKRQKFDFLLKFKDTENLFKHLDKAKYKDLCKYLEDIKIKL